MSDITHQFVLTRYSDGSWSWAIETGFSETIGEKEAFGYASLADLLEEQFKEFMKENRNI
jgi:hypothetical protein